MSFTLPDCNTIAAIIPYYSATGDSTSIFTANGSRLDCNCRIRTVINRLAHKQAADLSAIRQQAGNGKHSILRPLALSPRFVLFPVKVRKPKISGDPSIGYINLYAAKDIKPNRENSRQTLITLASGHQITAIWTASTVNKHLQQARLAAAYSPRTQTGFPLQEQTTAYDPSLAKVLHNLTELFYNIIKLKTAP